MLAFSEPNTMRSLPVVFAKVFFYLLADCTGQVIIGCTPDQGSVLPSAYVRLHPWLFQCSENTSTFFW